MTATVTPQRAFIRTLIDRDYTDPDGVATKLSADKTVPAITAAFAVAIGRRFGEGEDLREIARYAGELPARYQDGTEDIKPIVVEALIRTGFGAQDLLQGIDVDELVSLEVFITYDIVSGENLDNPQREALLDEIEASLAD